MENLLKELSPGLVLDATHPYAAEVTENIRDCLPKYRFFLPASIKRGRCLSG
ncbi:MAG: precorrin-6A/cobalt-precorrin-6A reductase [Ruminococcus sp.]